MNRRIHERGEGKVGCIVTLLVVIILGAAAWQIVPVYYSNNVLADAAERKADAAAGRTPEDLVKELREEARRLEIPEALAPNAITITKRSSTDVGLITVTLRYSRKVNLYGITDITIDTDRKLERPLLENVK